MYRTVDRHSNASPGSRRGNNGSTNSNQQPSDRQNIRRPPAHRYAREDLGQKLQIAADAVMNPHLAANSEMPLRTRTISPTVHSPQRNPAEQCHSQTNPMRFPQPRMHPCKHVERHEQRVSSEVEDVEKLVQCRRHKKQEFRPRSTRKCSHAMTRNASHYRQRQLLPEEIEPDSEFDLTDSRRCCFTINHDNPH